MTDSTICYYCKKVILKKDMPENTWYDTNGHYWHRKCGLKDDRLT